MIPLSVNMKRCYATLHSALTIHTFHDITLTLKSSDHSLPSPLHHDLAKYQPRVADHRAVAAGHWEPYAEVSGVGISVAQTAAPGLRRLALLRLRSEYTPHSRASRNRRAAELTDVHYIRGSDTEFGYILTLYASRFTHTDSTNVKHKTYVITRM